MSDKVWVLSTGNIEEYLVYTDRAQADREFLRRVEDGERCTLSGATLNTEKSDLERGKHNRNPLPCPFCGSIAIDMEDDDKGSEWMQCVSCYSRGPVAWINVFPRVDAKEAWNTRHGPLLERFDTPHPEGE